MVVTELYDGQGLGNQLWCAIVTRVIALDNGYDFGIMSPQKWKGADFLALDFGKPVRGGSGPEGGPPTTLPEGIFHYYREKKLLHPATMVDIRTYDEGLVRISDDTKIDGNMQDERYIAHRKDEIRKWLAVREDQDCREYASDDICIINFRGGDYVGVTNVFLPMQYWEDAMRRMREINPRMEFIVVTDDLRTARKFFPKLAVMHGPMAKDYSMIRNAHYLILSNSSFAWFPAWLNTELKHCIAPKYWSQYNVSDGYWGTASNITSGWMYLDRTGALSTYQESLSELEAYQANPDKAAFVAPPAKHMPRLWLLQIKIGRKLEKLRRYCRRKLSALQGKFLLLRKSMARRKYQKNPPTVAELSEYRKTIRVYDVFTFLNELELLELRLNILCDHVDYFVIVEATETFSGKPKKLIFADNKERFSRFSEKIIHYVIDDMPASYQDFRDRLANPRSELDREIIAAGFTSDNVPPGQLHWMKEFYQKESMRKALMGLRDEDFCYISDIDEIWNPESKIDYRSDSIFKFEQSVYAYYLNNRSNEPWAGTLAAKYEHIRHSCLNHLRTASKTQYTYVKNGGWHFTNQGGAERIKAKLESYGHQEFNTAEIKSAIEERMRSNEDFIGRNFRFWIDEKDLPAYLRENKAAYIKMFKPPSA